MPRRVWFVLALPAALLVVLSGLLALGVGIAAGGDDAGMRASFLRGLPWMLIANHGTVFVVLAYVVRAEGGTFRGIGWRMPPTPAAWLAEIAAGGSSGLLLGLVNVLALRPLIVWVQSITDVRVFTGPGPTSVATLLGWWSFTTVVAGVVEESVYRGYGLTRLTARFGVVRAVVISSLFFAPLHWAFGVAAVVADGLLGAALAAVYLWRRTLVAAAIAHAVINVVANLQ
jgi:membrane protease YdiL (CAAX protease family)